MKKALVFLLCLSVLFSLVACAGNTDPTASDTPSDGETTDTQPAEGGEIVLTDSALQSDYVCDDNNRVFYEIFVGSFSDSDGDGIGDLRGIINRMDYLNDGDPNSGKSLGVEGIWLTPIFQSPTYHKYDAADFYAIDDDFGTMEDLKELCELCHERNVKLIIDLAINHTAKSCAWFDAFKQAQKDGDTENEYYDFYSWCTADNKPAGRTFNKIPGADNYYECNFWSEMPELNYDNEQVRQTVLDIAKYYLDLGVDGFRFDAAKYIYYGDHAASVDFWSWYIGELRAYRPDIYTVAEVWDNDGITGMYYPALNCFNFAVSQADGLIASTANKGDINNYVSYVSRYLEKIQGTNADAMYLPFIANHDTDRAAGYLTVASGAMQMAANIYLLGPGSPFLYYGEELGMRGSRGGANTDANRRLAMLWGDGDTVKDPEGTTYEASNQIEAGVAEQIEDENSLYTYYKTLLMIRHANPEIARGEYQALQFSDKAGGFLSTWNGSTVCVIHNSTQREITLDLSEATDLSFTIRSVIGMESATLDGSTLTVGGQTSVVLKAG